MRLKTPIMCLFIAFAAIIFCACAPNVTLKTPGDSYSVTDVKFAGSIDGRSPSSGNTFLLITIRGENGNIEDMEQSFYNYERSAVRISDGSYSAMCKSAVYTQDSRGLFMTLVFEVPPSFGEEFSLSGDTFSSVPLKAKKQRN